MNFLRVFNKVICICLCAILFLSSCSTADSPATDLVGTGIGREESTTDSAPTADTTPQKNITICIDPGHGFADGGAVSDLLGDLTEKDITISISLMLKDKLLDMGYDVILTHNGNSFPKSPIDDGNQIYNTHERISYTNTLDIDMFVSVHCNSFSNPTASGTRIYFCEKAATDNSLVEKYSVELAKGISANLSDWEYPTVIPMAPADAFYVIRNCHVISALVETAFVTNVNDAAKLIDPIWQDNMAAGIAEGIDNYWTSHDNASGNTTADITE